MLISTINNNQKINFQAGKTKLYTDFDGTFMPFSHNDICNNDEFIKNNHKKMQFNNMYLKFEEFCKKMKTKFSFVITTGRSKAEFDYFIGKIKQQNLTFAPINALITRDGCDGFHKGFWGDLKLSKRKIKQLEKQAPGWNRDKIAVDLKQMLKKTNPEIVIVDSCINKHQQDYGELSLEYNLKRMPEKDKRYYASFEDKSKLNIDIAFPYGMNIDGIYDSFQKYCKEKKLAVSIEKYDPDFCSIIPNYDKMGNYQLMPARVISIKPMVDAKTNLTKLHDVKQKVSENIKKKNNDLIIVAGDGSNDETMLNPLNYLDLYGINISDNTNSQNIFKNQDLLCKLRELPFISIIVGNNPSLEHIRVLGSELDKAGVHKIICIQSPQDDFLKAIKQSISNYARQNNKYKQAIDAALFEDIVAK